MSAAIVVGRDAVPVLVFGEEVLGLVALVIEGLAISKGDVAAAARRDAGLDAPSFAFFAEPALS